MCPDVWRAASADPVKEKAKKCSSPRRGVNDEGERVRLLVMWSSVNRREREREREKEREKEGEKVRGA